MKEPHTLGPWTMGITPHYLRMGQTGCPITIRSPHHNTEEIATVWTCCMPTEANARLIAAAPELLEALKNLYENCAMIHKQWGDDNNQAKADEAIKAGRAAIAKATGGQES